MSLTVSLRMLEGLDGKSDRKIRGYFRGFPRDSKIVNAKDSAYIGDSLQWMVARKLDVTDTLEIRVYNVSRIGKDKLLGFMKMSLNELEEGGRLYLREHLIDIKNCQLKAMIVFELTLESPHVGITETIREDFNYPIVPLPKKKKQKDGRTVYQDSQLGDLDRDQMNFGFDDFSDNGSGLSHGDISNLSWSPKRELQIAPNLEATMFKEDDFQINVAIIEAQHLSGANINPLVELLCGNSIRRTRIEMSTSNPYFNDNFTFKYSCSHAELFDKVLVIRALAMGTNLISRILPGKLIGEFRIDMRTVWNAPDHRYMNKWALLLHPKDVLAGSKGYVKMSICIFCKSMPAKPKRAIEDGDEDNIEGNLLIPESMISQERQMATISVKIYRAEDLPKMNTDFMANIKEIILGETKPLADPLVQVSFNGHTGKTKKKSGTYTPEWNQEIVFTDMFPPLCNRIRVSVMDWQPVVDEVIATHYIELSQISNPNEEGFTPTFGPSWVNLYGTPRNYDYEQLLHPRDSLNFGLGEGVAFRGRLLMAVKTSIKQDSTGLVAGVRCGPTPPVSELVAGKREDFLLLGIVYEASVISQEIGEKKKPVHFELSIGTFGNNLDGRRYPHQKEDKKPLPKISVKGKGPAPQPPGGEKITWTHSTTDPTVPETHDGEYYYVPFGDRKPMLYTRCKFEDHRPRMHIPNMIDKMREEFEKGLQEVEIMHQRQKRGAHRRLRAILVNLAENLVNASDSVRSCRGTGSRTFLDKERQRLYRTQFEKLNMKLRDIRKTCEAKNLHEKLKEAQSMNNVIKELAKEPQHGLPDVFVWLISEGKRLAFARLPARKIANSVVEDEMGKDCGQVVTLFLRKPGRKGVGSDGWAIQAKINIFLWLGLFRDAKVFKDLIPIGYDNAAFRGIRQLPFELHYTEYTNYRFRAYLFMARNLIGSDESGLSDAFVRILLNEHVLTSYVINQTLSPCWDCTLEVPEMHFYFSDEYMHENPPVVVVEIYDEDIVLMRQSTEFIGRAFCRPVINNCGAEYTLPKLEWWDIYRAQSFGGELLASFELKQISTDPTGDEDEEEFDEMEDEEESERSSEAQIEGPVDENRLPDLMRVPKGIRPSLSVFRLEVLFWGMRNLKRLMLLNVNSPKIYIEFGGYHLESDMIHNVDDRANFVDRVKYINVYLPENKSFWPPMQIQCRDCRQFGQEALVGTNLIGDVSQFYKKSEEEIAEEIAKMETASTCLSSHSSDPSFLSGFGGFESSTGSVGPGSVVSHGASHTSHALGSKLGSATGSKTNKRQGSTAGTLDALAQGPGTAIEIPKRSKVPRDELNDLDWWSRYYATLKDLRKDTIEKRNESQYCLLESDSDVDGNEMLKQIKVELKNDKDDDDDDIVDIPEDAPKKRKKKKKKKKRRKGGLPFRRANPAKVFREEEIDDTLIFEENVQEDDSWIERVKVFRHSLEDIKEYNSVKHFYRTFPLTRGKVTGDEPIETRTVGVFKGNFMLYKLPGVPPENEKIDEDELFLAQDLPSSEVRFMSVRVYIIRAFDLRGLDLNGRSDPFINVSLGSRKTSDREAYIPKQLNPYFGRVFEFDARFPQEATLTISVRNHERIGIDSLIGQTVVDLENRIFSKHRQHCGLAKNYDNHGYNRWRDVVPPTRILASLCKEHDFAPPKYEPLFNRVIVNDMEFYAVTEIEDDGGDIKQSNEPLALEVLKNWKKLSGYSLVPEHVETRSLYEPNKPGIVCGRVEMWVDILPKELGIPPAPTDITPREPKSYELRCIIWDTEDVILADDSILTGDKSSDIFVKGWVKGSTVDAKETDVHYRSLTGEGNFNWRFIFPFDYMKAEDMVVFYRKETKIDIDETQFKVPCKINLQVWDANLIGSHTFLGDVSFRLSRIPRGARSAKACGLHQLKTDGSVPTLSIFRNKRCRGWWPFMMESEDDPSEMEVAGKVDVEFELVSSEEAEQNPVGEGRSEPNALPSPKRPESSFFDMLNPLRALKYLICVRLKRVIIKALIMLAIMAFLGLFLYTSPGYIVKKILGA